VVAEHVGALEDEPLPVVGQLDPLGGDRRDGADGGGAPSRVTGSSRSTTTGAGGPPRRKPSLRNGPPVSRPARNTSHAASRRAGPGSGGATVPSSRWRSSHAVSMDASRNSSPAAKARRNPTFVVRPRTAVPSSAATSVRRADSRSGPVAMTLPSIGS
jgi:hypothetical protein